MTPTIRTGLVALALTTAFSILPAQPTGRPTSPRATDSELSLLGIRLLDPGIKVINKYGTPDEILGLSTGGGGGASPSGTGSSAPGTGPSGGGGNSGGGGGNTGSSAAPLIYRPGDVIGDPFGSGTNAFRQFSPDGDGGDGGAPRSPSRGGSSGGGAPSSPSAAGAGPGGGGPGGGGGGGAAGTATIFTRWVYKKGTSQFSFVFDKGNRVVQIEALGLNDYRVKTRKGGTFGWDFGKLIKTYGAPESYEVGGQNLVVKYLVKKRVAFRLSRLRPNEKHRVTGIVIAAGKD